jgi:hypothetical protein
VVLARVTFFVTFVMNYLMIVSDIIRDEIVSHRQSKRPHNNISGHH